MKALISILIGLLVVGCGKKQFTNTTEGNKTSAKPAKKKAEKETPSTGDDKNSTTTKELTAEEKKLVGEYEDKWLGDTGKMVLLGNGTREGHVKGLIKEVLGSWKVSDKGEVHLESKLSNLVRILRINPDGSLTGIAQLRNGSRRDLSEETQSTYKKIK